MPSLSLSLSLTERSAEGSCQVVGGVAIHAVYGGQEGQVSFDELELCVKLSIIVVVFLRVIDFRMVNNNNNCLRYFLYW